MPLRRRSCLTAAAGAVAATSFLLAGAEPSPAAKITETTYAVTAEVKLTYGHSSLRAEADGTGSERTTDAVVAMTTTIDDVLFRNGKLQNPDQWGLGDASVTGSGKRIDKYRDERNDLQTRTYTCTPIPETTLGRAILSDNPDMLEPLGPGERLTMRLAEGMRVDMPCPGTDPIGLMMDGAEPFGQGLLDTDFDLPGEAIGMGTIIQLVHSTPAQEAADRCPGRDDHTTRCTVSWEGTIRFDRTSQNVFDDGTAQPQPQPQPPVTPKRPADDSDLLAPLVPPADDSDLLAPLVPAKSASLDGGTLRFRAGCAAGCSGTLSVVTGGAKAAGYIAKAPKPAVVRFTVKPGKSARTISVKLPAKVRSALRRAKRPAVKVTLKPKRGGGKAVTRTLTVKRAR